MSSSTKPKDGSLPKNGHAKKLSIQGIIKKLTDLLNRLSDTKETIDHQVTKDKGSKTQVVGQKDHGDKPSTGADDGSQKEGGDVKPSTEAASTGADDGSPKKGGDVVKGGAAQLRTEANDEMKVHTQLDKVCEELRYIISAFTKLKEFEKDISEPLDTLESNVNDIQADLKGEAFISDMVKKQVERNLKVLRGNITKVKIQIPLQHQVSALTSDKYLQTAVATKEAGHLPTPYEAKEIFESSSFVKEFRDHYESLEDRHKLCLLCFAIFPEDAEVKKRLLKFWWVGERLSTEGQKEEQQPKSSDNQQQRTNQAQKEEQRPNLLDQEEKLGKFVDETLEKFVKMGFIEPVTKKSKSPPTSYKMHPIVRSLIIKFAKEANFFDYDPKGKPTMNISASKKSCLTKSESKTEGKSEVTTPWFSKMYLEPKSSNKQKQKQEEKQPKDKKQEQEQEEKERKEKKKQRQRDLERLQTLFNVSKQFPDFPVKLFSKMRNIGVLYLGRWERTTMFRIEVKKWAYLEGLKNLKLRFFSLQGIPGISVPPDSLCKLTNLRILDLRACHSLEVLPERIGSLKKLTHLDLSECYLLAKMPKELSQLSQLQILKGFVIRRNSPCSLEDLAALPKLEKLSINVNDEVGVAFSNFKALKKLKIAWGSGGEGAKSKFEKNGENKKPESGAEKKRGLCDRMLKLKPRGGTKPGSKQNEKEQEIGLTKLVKLDLQCFPEREPPNWLLPKKLSKVENSATWVKV
ncbi:hypothetical protein PTKIN_Ptkin05aG0005600 [Pterospermum kingtungense]